MKILILCLFSIIVTMEPTQFLEMFKQNIITPDPPEISRRLWGQVDYGNTREISYFSKIAERDKKAIVILPAGYDENNKELKYPVIYINHGVFGNANNMLNDDLGIQVISGNLMAKGEAEKMIIVLTNMWTSKTQPYPLGQFNDEMEKSYDNFINDITDDLIPFIEKNFNAKTGRENRAISGFSMGGREAIYIGISRPDLFAYISGACPAPGIVPAQDMFMYHRGSMTPDEFKIKDNNNLPYILFITAGTNDGTVGNFPYEYHQLFTKNNCNHAFQEVPGGGHGGVSVRSHFYNLFRFVFKGNKN